MAGKRRAGAGAVGGLGGGVGAPPALNASASAAAAPNTRALPPRAKSSGNGNLTNLQRKRICEFHRKSGGVMSQKDLAQWTKHEFGLQKTPAQSTISGILRRQHEFVNMSALELGIKKRRVVQHPLLDQALANWVIQCAHRGITVQGDMTKEKAKHFAKMLAIPEDERPEFSNGWLHSFQMRHNFSFRKFNAESSANSNNNNTSGAAASAGAGVGAGTRTGDNKRVLHFSTMDALVLETDKYELANIFAMDETCVLYTLPPTQFAAQEEPLRAKKRFVVALAANADGSEKLQPLFVSHHESPKCFKKKSAEQHGLHYFWNPKAWMTGVIFSRWVQRLDFAMATQKRRVLLFLNDAPSHVVSHLELTNVVLFVLPSGASQMLNPVTASLVTAFKKRFRRHHLRHAIDKGDDVDSHGNINRKFAFDIDVLQAMKWAAASWDEVAKDTVERSWAMTHMIPDRLSSLRFHDADDAELAFLDTELAHLLLFLRFPDVVPVAEYLNDESKGEHSVHEEFFEVVQHADEVPDDDYDVDNGGDDGITTPQPSLSLQEKLKAFRDVLQVLKDRDDSDDATSALRRVEDAIRTEARTGTDHHALLGDAAIGGASNRPLPPSEDDGGNSGHAAFDSASLDFASATITALENEAKLMSDAAAAAAASAAAEAMLSQHHDDDVGGAFDHADL